MERASKNIFERLLQLKLPPKQSAFLWGARKTGKSTLLKQNFPESIYFDFLNTDLYYAFLKEPFRLRQNILEILRNQGNIRTPIIIDEVQKIPDILDEVHWLIENHNLKFILCGSSARKMRRGHANLIGGRAWRFSLLPLCKREIPEFNLLRALNNGLIPLHYLENDAKRSLKSYIQDYLKEEIFAEGLTRNIKAFSHFTDILGFSNGELVNFSYIAREVGVDANTIKEYFQILDDTLIGYLIYPFTKRAKRNVLTKTPKFYLFDVGIAGYLERRIIQDEKGPGFGKAFEHFLFMELQAHRTYTELDYSITFWRTTSAQEVDFILDNGKIAIEVKGTSNITNKETKNLRSFISKFTVSRAIIVCNELLPRRVNDIEIIPWELFLEQLWNGEIIG